MKIGVVATLIALAVACKPRSKTLQVLDFGPFTLKAPANWSIVNRQSMDSYAGGLTNGADSLWFDYGRYDVKLTTDSGYWYRLSEDTVSGFRAVFSVPESWQRGEISMKIPTLNGKRFTMWGSNVKDTATILAIFKSAMFAGSDSSANPPLPPVGNFERTNVDGDSYFIAECRVCHGLRHVDGPRLRDFVDTRSADWLYRFFTDSAFRAKDKLHQSWKRQFNNMECPEIRTMTREDAVAVYYYIKSQPY